MGRPRKHRDYMEPLRRCHDCGRPTADYRCAACRAKHLAAWRKDRGIDFQNWIDDWLSGDPFPEASIYIELKEEE